MTITAIDGFDAYNGAGANTGLQAKWAFQQFIVGSAAASMIAGRFGGQAARYTISAANTGIGSRRSLPSSQTTICGGFAFRTSTFSYVHGDIFWILNGGTYQDGLRIDSSGFLIAGRYSGVASPTTLGTTSSQVIFLNTWHYIGYEITIDSSAGVFNVWVDGTQVLALSGVNTENSGTTANNIQIGISAGNASETFDFDDVYVTDSSYLGERRIETLRPASDSSVVFAPNSGVTNYTQVDDTVCDGDTTYVSSSNSGDRDLYTIVPLGSTPAAIDAVQVSSFAEKTDATTRQIYHSIQSAGTDSDGSAFALAASYGKFERIIANDPHTGVAWTPSGVNNLLFGPKVA